MRGGQVRIPEPDVMPVNREAWAKELNLSNFVNAYYQFRDVESFGSVKSILVVGPGQGLDTAVFRWRGYQVTTFDIDETFQPDVIGSCHDMQMFRDSQFDVVIASHVLEHLPLPYLDTALAEIARVGRFALVYLPVTGRHFHFRIVPGMLGIDLSLIIDLLPFWHKPDGMNARYCQGQHYWEVGLRNFRKADLVKRFSAAFEVLRVYRNRDWTPSQNFVLRSRLAESVMASTSASRGELP
jgi:hypothetical protein